MYLLRQRSKIYGLLGKSVLSLEVMSEELGVEEIISRSKREMITVIQNSLSEKR